MSFCSSVSRVVFVSVVAFTAPATAIRAGLNAPPEIAVALGWEPASSAKWKSPSADFYNVSSEPGAWKSLLPLTTEWQADAIGFDTYPADAVFRKLTRLQALALNANQPEALRILRQENDELPVFIARIRRLVTGSDSQSSHAKTMADRLDELHKVLTPWLQEYPEAKATELTNRIKEIQEKAVTRPISKYGGELKFNKLVALGREQRQLVDALAAAKKDTTTPEPARSQARREAAGKLAYFNAYNSFDEDWLAASKDPEMRPYLSDLRTVEPPSLNVDDLLPLVGEERMTTLLKQAFSTPANVILDKTTTTGALALKLFRNGELKPELTPWSLLAWPRRADRAAAHELVLLHDQMKEKWPTFTATHPDDKLFHRTRAIAGVAYALAVDGRMDEAVQILRGVDAGQRGFGYNGEPTQEVASTVFDLIAKVADANASKEVWEQLKDQARNAKRSADLIALATRRAEEAPAGSVLAQRWRVRQGWALIATEKVDAGLALLAPENGLPLGGLPLVEADADVGQTKDDRGASFAAIFRLLNALPKPEIAARVTKQLTVDFQDANNAIWSEKELENAFVRQLFRDKNYALAVTLLRARSATMQRNSVSKKADQSSRDSSSEEHQLTWQLADALGRSGDHEAVVELLAASPNWAHKDLRDDLRRGYANEGFRPLPLIAAESLNEVGRRQDAVVILEALLAEQGGNDSAYALYTKIVGQGALPFLENLFASDRFEERPLIWKAVLQLQAGQVDKAETTVKQAIAIDPSDGEQPKGDRMRAYAVLREVALKKGDSKQAAFLANVVAAIRRSENADDLSRSGLTSRAIAEYDAALDQFGDAYCIQARIARELAEAGRAEEAAEHYKRAFELMPESFGRVESHCFGCEGAFYEGVAQITAEKVLMDAAKKPGVKPQVYYLLGYLRGQQKRWDEAVQYYLQATAADPDYLNAWRKLQDVLAKTTADRALRDRVTLALMRIAPAEYRSRRELDALRDFAGLWKVYAETNAVEASSPSRVFPLGDRARGSATSQVGPMDRITFNRLSAKDPGRRISEARVMSALRYSLVSARVWGED